MIMTPIRCHLVNYIQSSAEKLVEQTYAEFGASNWDYRLRAHAVARALHKEGFSSLYKRFESPIFSDAAKEKAIGLVPVRVLIGVKQSGQQVVWNRLRPQYMFGGPRQNLGHSITRRGAMKTKLFAAQVLPILSIA